MSVTAKLSSTVRAVTVYRRGALVTREARLAPGEGGFPTRIQLVGLPLTLDDSSVRIEVDPGEGREGSGPIAGDLRVTLAVPDEDPELPPPTNAELDRAQLEVELASDARDHLLRAAARLAKLQPGHRGAPEEGKAPGPSPTAARLELISFRSERSDALAGEIEAARERVRVAKEQLESYRERERLASSQRNARTHELRKAAIVELLEPDRGSDGGRDSQADGVILRLHYFVPGARWAPAYTVRLERDMRGGTLELRALVGQATGEDWGDVALTLSTASPQQWTELPELQSRRIGRRQPPPAKTGWRPPPVGAAELYADYDRGLGDAKPASAPPPKSVVVSSPPPAPPPPPFESSELFAHGDTGDFDDFDEERSAPARSRTRSGVMPSGAKPAPNMAPPSAPMPMPQMEMQRSMPPAAAMPVAAKRSAGLGSLVGGAIDGIASAFASEGGGGGPPGAGASAPPPEPELLAGRDLLDYGRLRLMPGSSSRRGALRRVELRVQYEELSVERVEVAVALDHIRGAVDGARRLESKAAPAHHRWPETEAGFDYAYVAEGPVDLPSTGAFESLPILLSAAEATPRYVSVPRETQDVFRVVALRNPLDAPLLPGPADVYVAGKFALSSDLELTPRGGRIELGLGVEQAVKIARNVDFSEDSSGMFKRALELHHSVRVEIQNHLPSAAKVEVRERLPVAASHQAEDIEITVDEVTPSWDDYEPEPKRGPALEGGRVWTVEVPAAGKRELKAKWTVRIPANHELQGGNRRES